MNLRLFADSRGHGTCASCHASIEWAELTTGKRMPFNRIAPVDAYEMGGRVVEVVDETSPSHFATCPFAASHRRPRGQR